jgi:hypothetical protein
MGSLVALKQQLAVVEAECSLLQNLTLNLHRGDQIMALNPRTSANSSRAGLKKEESVHQFDKEMEPMSQEGEPASTGLEDAASHYAQCDLNVF